MHVALIKAVILPPRERRGVKGVWHQPPAWWHPAGEGKLLSPEPAPYLNVRLLRDLCAIGQVVRLGVVLPQQLPAGWETGISSDLGFGERTESFGDEVGQVGYAGPTTSLGSFGKEGKKNAVFC